MKFDDFIKILLALGSLTAGAVITAVRNKLGSLNEKNRLHYFFYFFGISVILTSIIASYSYANELKKPNWLGIIVILISIVSSIGLIWFTKKHLVGKFDYKTSELNPIINEFTKNADKATIKLFGGDLNFFGNTPVEMDGNSQYTVLKAIGFENIQILCEEPNSNTSKIRYGKIISDMPIVDLKFYNPKHADLLIRGRMKTLQGVVKLLIYQRVKSGVYRALETDTGNSNGALYNNIWNLVWSLARTPRHEELEEYNKLFRN